MMSLTRALAACSSTDTPKIIDRTKSLTFSRNNTRTGIQNELPMSQADAKRDPGSAADRRISVDQIGPPIVNGKAFQHGEGPTTQSDEPQQQGVRWHDEQHDLEGGRSVSRNTSDETVATEDQNSQQQFK